MVYFFSILLLNCFLLESSHAGALGEKFSPVVSQSKMAANNVTAISKVQSMNSSLGAPYSVNEVTSESRTVKEFINANGLIFAITWKGQGRPDFSQIFGVYYSEFKFERQAEKLLAARSRNHLEVKGENLVVSSFGHGNILMGIAYLPKFMPAGLTAEDLR